MQVKQALSTLDLKLKRAEEDSNRLHTENKMIKAEYEQTQQKLEKAEEKLDKLNRLQRENKKFEKENEYFQKINEQKSTEIENLLKSLKEKDDYIQHLMANYQHYNIPPHVQDDKLASLKATNNKLKSLLERMQEDYFKLEEENNAIKETLENEIELREQIVEDFMNKSKVFEEKIELFGEFERNMDEFRRYLVSVRT